VTITGVPPFDGEYVFDVGQLNGHEYHLIKQVSGVRANELDEAIFAGDAGVHIALAAIAIQQKGHPAAEGAVEVLMNVRGLSKIRMEFANRLNGADDGTDPHQPTASE
jgi:hypothetical protein